MLVMAPRCPSSKVSKASTRVRSPSATRFHPTSTACSYGWRWGWVGEMEYLAEGDWGVVFGCAWWVVEVCGWWVVDGCDWWVVGGCDWWEVTEKPELVDMLSLLVDDITTACLALTACNRWFSCSPR
jgi:hypothetical protein